MHFDSHERMDKLFDLLPSGMTADQIVEAANKYQIDKRRADGLNVESQALEALRQLSIIQNAQLAGQTVDNAGDDILVSFSPASRHEPVGVQVKMSPKYIERARREHREKGIDSRRIFITVRPKFSDERIKDDFLDGLKDLDGFIWP